MKCHGIGVKRRDGVKRRRMEILKAVRKEWDSLRGMMISNNEGSLEGSLCEGWNLIGLGCITMHIFHLVEAWSMH